MGAQKMEKHGETVGNKHMAWKSFYLAKGIMTVAALPFFAGATGTEYLPDGPCIVTGNHSSYLDGPLLAVAYAAAKQRPLHMIAYEEPFRHWLMGWILRSGGCIPFRRGDRRSQSDMLRTALGWLAAGEAVGLFPEGHINQRERLNRPRPGAAMLALESRMPIIPVAITGSARALPRGSRYPKPLRNVRLRFGPPVMLLRKEMDYPHLSRVERKEMIENLGFRIMTAIGLLAGRKYSEPENWNGEEVSI